MSVDEKETWEAERAFANETTAQPAVIDKLGRLRLLVFGNETFVTHPLPPSGEISVGRSDEADIRIDDPSISRLHARLYLDAPSTEGFGIAVEDLGSSNGTFLRGKQIQSGERRPVSAGEVVDVGQTMIIVQHSATAGRPHRFWTHGYFEMRLEEECERARASGNTFSVVRVRCSPGADPGLVEASLTSALRPYDLIACYAPSEYEILLVDTTLSRARQLADRLKSRLAEMRIEAHTSMAMYPDDGLQAEALVAEAGARVRGSRSTTSADRVVVAEDSAMQQIYRLLNRIAPSNISVLILGETGVGKEVIAEEVHRRSQRRGKPLLELNCAALSESLLESELFGHERGAFSGAIQLKKGLLESADGGTVFLDEIGELPVSLQVELLRVLEEGKVRRVGGVEDRSIDVRYIAATNRDLESEIERGAFRMDLFYRLNGISIVLPPLRERLEEIRPLAESFATHSALALNLADTPTIAPAAFSLLKSYPWPGNIRELKNIIERAVLLADRGVIGPDHLPVEKMSASLHRRSVVEITRVPPRRGVSHLRREEQVEGDELSAYGETEDTLPAQGPMDNLEGGLRSEIEELERKRIIEALAKCGGVQTKAAKMLGMSRGTLLSRLDTYNIPRPRKTRAK